MNVTPSVAETASFTLLPRPQPIRLKVQSAVREMIVKRALKPGEHVAEQELAARLKVSRQPVREALQALAQQGWVDLRVGRGAFIHVPTDREVNEVFGVRGILEAEAARLAAARVTPDDVGRLRELCDAGRQALTSGADDDVVAANSRFHGAITALADNDLLGELLSSLDQRIRWHFAPLARRRGADSWNEHDEVVDAMQSGQADRAGELMRAHSLNTTAVYNRLSAAEQP